MATTATQITMEAYLNSIFHPDMEYVDGELKERNVGSYEHSRLQALITRWFGNNELAWGVQVVTEQRTRTSNTNILIPDVALLPRGPQPRVIADPPILALEILSPEDRYSDMTVKIRKFLLWGVKSVWIIDPDEAVGEEPRGQMWTAPFVCTSGTTLIVEGTAIHLGLKELFKALKDS